MPDLPLAVFLAPLFMLFEIVQLVGAERLLGVKQIEAGIDPRANRPSEPLAALWCAGIVMEALWLLWLLGEDATRLHSAGILLVWLVGFSLRGNTTLRWVLVILTIEGALRLGLMVSMFGAAWRAL